MKNLWGRSEGRLRVKGFFRVLRGFFKVVRVQGFRALGL